MNNIQDSVLLSFVFVFFLMFESYILSKINELPMGYYSNKYYLAGAIAGLVTLIAVIVLFVKKGV